MRKFILLIFMCLMIIDLTGCGAVKTSDYLADTGIVLSPKGLLQNDDDATVRAKSMQALIDSFLRYGWSIHTLDKVAGKITAEACKRGQHCMEVEATVKDDGIVEIIRTPGQTITAKEAHVLKGWIGKLKRYYNRMIVEGMK